MSILGRMGEGLICLVTMNAGICMNHKKPPTPLPPQHLPFDNSPLNEEYQHNWNPELQEEYFKQIDEYGVMKKWEQHPYGGVWKYDTHVKRFKDLLQVTDYEYAYRYTIYKRHARGTPDLIKPRETFYSEEQVPELPEDFTKSLWFVHKEPQFSSRACVISRYLTKCAMEHAGYEYKPLLNIITEYSARDHLTQLPAWDRLLRYL
jgi:hypothetical protein